MKKNKRSLNYKVQNLNKQAARDTGDFKFRVAGKNSRVYKELKALLGDSLKGDRIVYFGTKNIPSGQHEILSEKQFNTAYAKSKKAVSQHYLHVYNKGTARAETVKAYMKHFNEIEGSGMSPKEKFARAYRYQIQASLNKEMYLEGFIRGSNREAVKMLREMDPYLETSEWKYMTTGEKRAFFIENFYGVRKDSTIWYYGDSM